MTRPTDEQLLAFLEGDLPGDERARLLDRLASDPELAEEVRLAAAGLEAVTDDRPAPASGLVGRKRVSPWWVVAASVATLAVSVPVTLRVARGAATEPDVPAAPLTGIPEAPAPSFVLVLHGRWPDAAELAPSEARRRAEEYWGWTSALAAEGILVAAGDLRWEPGERLGPSGTPIRVTAAELGDPDYVVGMFALRASSYEQALELARRCPHLSYGGTVSVRRVGSGFVTVPGMGDWTD